MPDESLSSQPGIKSFGTYAAEVLVKQDRLAPENMALLVTCMDYRYPHRVVAVMDELGLSGMYDHFVLAGASLGAHVPDWQNVLVEHIKVAVLLEHPIKKIVIPDHRDCGAYRHPNEIGVPTHILDKGLKKDIRPSMEMKFHVGVPSKLVPVLKERLKEAIPDLKVDAILLTRDEDDVMFQDQ